MGVRDHNGPYLFVVLPNLIVHCMLAKTQMDDSLFSTSFDEIHDNSEEFCFQIGNKYGIHSNIT